MFGNIYYPSLVFWIYFIIIFTAVSLFATISFFRHRSEWPKAVQYFALYIILISAAIAIILITMGYPYSEKVFQFNSLLSREIQLVPIYGVILLLIGLVVFIILLKVDKSNRRQDWHK